MATTVAGHSSPRSVAGAGPVVGTSQVPPSRDPTKTIAIRRSFRNDIDARLGALKKLVKAALVEHDILGLGKPTVNSLAFTAQMSLLISQLPRMSHHPDDRKVLAFDAWFTEAAYRMVVDRRGWWITKYIDKAYDYGIRTAKVEVNAPNLVLDANPYHVKSGEKGGQFASGPTHSPAISTKGKPGEVATILDPERAKKLLPVKARTEEGAEALFHATLKHEDAWERRYGKGHLAFYHEVPGNAVETIRERGIDSEYGVFASLRVTSEFVTDPDNKTIVEFSVPRDKLKDVAADMIYHGYEEQGFGPYQMLLLSHGTDLRGAYVAYPDAVPKEWVKKVRWTGQFAAPKDAIITDTGRAQAIVALAQVELMGATDAMIHNVGRAMASGLLAMKKPSDINALVAAQIDAIGQVRLRALASTYIVRAFNEGKLDVYEAVGIKKVGMLAETRPHKHDDGHEGADVADASRGRRPKIKKRKARVRRFKTKPGPEEQARIERRERRLEKLGLVEVLTAGDDKVCFKCEDISDAGPYDINQARGLIPAHPNCRCAFIPADEREDDD